MAAIRASKPAPSKPVEREVKRFIHRLQRDIDALSLALVQERNVRKIELSRLIKSQARDDKERNLRFENAIRK